jgi:hypothetical protein
VPPELLEELAGNTAYVDAVVRLTDVVAVAELLAPVARREAGAAQVVRVIKMFEGHLANVMVLVVVGNVAQYFARELLQLEWLTSALASALSVTKLENVQENMRVVSALANCETFVKEKPLMKAIVRLLASAECDVVETTLLMEIFVKISPHCSLVDIYQFVLLAAESQTLYTAAALSVLISQSLPKVTTRYSVRLIAVVKRFLESGKEEQLKVAAAIVARMTKRSAYVLHITDALYPESIRKALLATRDGHVFESLLLSMKKCRATVGAEVAQAAERLSKEMGEGGEPGSARDDDLRIRIVKLANELK